MKCLWEVEREANKLYLNTGRVSAFSCHLLIDGWMGVSRDAEHVGEVQNDFTFCFARQTGSACIFLPVVD